jgi:hypothetical protein
MLMARDGAVVEDKSRREAERKRSEALIAQITGGAAISLRREARRLTEKSSDVVGSNQSSAAQRDIAGAGRGTLAAISGDAHAASGPTTASVLTPHAASGPTTASVLTPQRIRFNRYDQDGDGVLDRAEVRAFLRDQARVDTRTLSRPGFMADVMRDYGHSGSVPFEKFEALATFADGLSRTLSESLSHGAQTGDASEADPGGTSSAVDNVRLAAPTPAAALFEEKRAARNAHEAAERAASLEAQAQQHAYSRLRTDWRKSGQTLSSTNSLQEMKNASERAKRRAQMQRDFAQACVRNRQPSTGMDGTRVSSVGAIVVPSRPSERGYSSYTVDPAASTRTALRPPASVRTPASSSLDVAKSSRPDWTGEYRLSVSPGMTSTTMEMADDSAWELQLSPTGTSLVLPGTPALANAHTGPSVHHNFQHQSLVLHPQQQLGAVPAFGGWNPSS